MNNIGSSNFFGGGRNFNRFPFRNPIYVIPPICSLFKWPTSYLFCWAGSASFPAKVRRESWTRRSWQSSVWCELVRNTCPRNCICWKETNKVHTNGKNLNQLQMKRRCQVLLEEFLEHGVVDQFRSGAVHLDDLFFFGIEWVEGAEGQSAVPEQNQKVFTLRSGDLL